MGVPRLFSIKYKMEIFIWVIIFAVSIAALIKSADYFTDSAEKIGLFFGLSPFIIGVTIVSIGTSLPELAAGIVAAFKGGEATSLVLANIIGSNITNILLILGIGAIVGRFIKVRKDLIKLDLPLLSLATTLFVLMIAWDRILTSLEAFLLLIGYSVYLWYVFRGHEGKTTPKSRGKLSWRVLSQLFLSTLFLYISAKYTVESVLSLANLFNIAPSLMSLTVVALGTSLPELSVTIAAVRRKSYEVAIGNIFGSNIVNLLFVGAVPALITPLVIAPQVFFIGLPFLIAVTLLYVIVSLDREVRNYEGAMFLLIYLAYLILLITNAF